MERYSKELAGDDELGQLTQAGKVNHYEKPWTAKDQVNNGNNIKVEFTGELTEGQKTAADSLLNCEYGVLTAPPNFGKTVLGASLIASRKVNTLIQVHLKKLLDQWVDQLNQYLYIDQVLPEDGQYKRVVPNRSV